MKRLFALVLEEESGVQSWSWSHAWSHWTGWSVWSQWFSLTGLVVLLGSEVVSELAPPSLLFSLLKALVWFLAVLHSVVSERSVKELT